MPTSAPIAAKPARPQPARSAPRPEPRPAPKAAPAKAKPVAPALPAFARSAIAPLPLNAQAPPTAAAHRPLRDSPAVRALAKVVAPILQKPTASPSPKLTAPATPKPTAPPSPSAAKPRPKLASLAPAQHSTGGGQPLAAHVREAVENSLLVDLSSVRLHASTAAQRKAQSLRARAFTFGNDIFLGHGEHPTDLTLITHEAAHVIQQQGIASVHAWSQDRSDPYEREADRAAAAVARGETFAVRERVSSPRVQRLGISDALDYLADKAYYIPGFRMFTIVLGVNPINMETVERSAANVLRAIVEFIPGGALITQALDKYGVFDKVGNWVNEQIETLGLVGSSIKQALMDFLDSLSWRDIFHLGDVWERAKRIFTDPITRIKNFVVGLAEGIWEFVRKAILMPLAELASRTAGWDLLTAVMGKNPITGEAVPRTPETLIGGFMKLIHEEEVWQNIQRANAIPRAWAWFQGVLSGLLGFVSQIPSLFIEALKSLEWTDVINLPSGFMKVARVFGNFLVNFISWAGEKVWNLLQLIFEVVAPAVMPYLRKVGAAFRKILKDPLGFMRNLIRGALLGIKNFAAHFFTHMKAALLDWLVGAITGVYIPKALSLEEFGKLALSVLSISWAQIRAKIVKVLGPNGETIMSGLEKGFDIVVSLVTGGAAAAWNLIQENLTSLKDTLIGGIVGLVTDTITKQAIPKLVAMFIPGAGFISAIVSIYDTIMVFVSKLAKIAEAVTAFVDSIVAIASGQIGGAAARIETALEGVLSLVISFLTSFFGLGNIASKVLAVVEKVRTTVEKALDTAINWVVGKAKALFAKLFGGKKDDKDPASGDVRAQAAAELKSQLTADHTREDATGLIAGILDRLRPQGLKSLTLGPEDEDGIATIEAEASPKLPLLKLIPRGLIPKGRSVKMVVQLELSIAPAAATPKMTAEEQARIAAGTLAKQVTALGTTIPVADPGIARTLAGGAILQPPASAAPSSLSHTVTLATWNTANQGLHSTGNSSHAEHQFVEWLENKGAAFMQRIDKITVNIQPYSPCSVCSDELCYALAMIKRNRGDKPVEASLAWSIAYPGAMGGLQMTTSQSLSELSSAGWALSGGSVPSDTRFLVHVEPLK